MVRISYSKQVRDFIDAADVSGNIRNDKAAKSYLSHIDATVQTIGRSKFKALYPFVGGVVGSHKFNYCDPRDLDAAFRLNFVSTWTHNSLGSTAANLSYARTFLVPSTSLTLNNTHMSFYSGTENKQMGCNNSTSQEFQLFSNIYTEHHAYNNDFAGGNWGVLGSSKGLVIGNRTASNAGSIYFNDGRYVTTNTGGGSLPTVDIYLAAINSNGSSITNPTTQRYSFASIGEGLTRNESQFLSSQVQFAQRILGRAV